MRNKLRDIAVKYVHIMTASEYSTLLNAADDIPSDKLDRVRAEIEKMSKCGIMRSMPMTIRADSAKEILRIIDKIKSDD